MKLKHGAMFQVCPNQTTWQTRQTSSWSDFGHVWIFVWESQCKAWPCENIWALQLSIALIYRDIVTFKPEGEKLVHCCTLSLCYLGTETDDHHRNPNINDRDHLVGQLTRDKQFAVFHLILWHWSVHTVYVCAHYKTVWHLQGISPNHLGEGAPATQRLTCWLAPRLLAHMHQKCH